MIGQTLMDKYRIDKRIGKGAFGEVYRAFDTVLKREVAVKFLVDSGHEDAFKKRFERESESMAQLMHSNIVAVFDCGDFNGRPFMVMELVDGITLLELIEKSTPEPAEVFKITVQVCRAMTYAHERGVIHRDLKLTNIMINSDGEAKILDFGLAKLVHAEVQSDPNVRVGTPAFFSPEQAAGEEIDHRADIWAFGVCLYRMLNGRFPFEAEHPTTLLYMIANDDPAPFEPDVPFDVQDVVLKCLEKRQDDRYESFGELERRVKNLLKQYQDSDSQFSSQRTVSQTLTVRSSKRNPYLNRVMIKNPDEFFGRSKEIKRIYSRLDAPRPQSISIVGERRVGKSSLLNFIYQRRNRRVNMQNHHNSIFIYMDFQQGKDLDIPKFIDILFGMFKYEKNKRVTTSSSDKTLDMLKVEVEELNNKGKRIVVLMDEFESVTTNPNFDMQFFSFLRFLANNYKVAYVTSSYSDLQQMCHDKDIADSPFFNIFSNLPLRPFSHEEALELIKVPSEQEGLPLEAYASKILEISGYFPFFIQMACSNVFEYLVENDGAEPDWRQIVDSFREEAEHHYTYIWDRMDENCRKNLRRIASGKQIDKKYRHINEDLERRGYLVDCEGGCELFSKPFRDFVLAQVGKGKQKAGFFSSVFGRRGNRR